VITLYVLAFIIASLLYRRRHRHIDISTVRRLELERYMGRWYEIARYDRPFERRLRNIEARYTLRADGNVEMERAGIDIRTGRRHTSCRHARRTQRSGRLRVKNFIFLHTDYCILELDDQYQWALVGSTAPLRLQILSRQPRILERHAASHRGGWPNGAAIRSTGCGSCGRRNDEKRGSAAADPRFRSLRSLLSAPKSPEGFPPHRIRTAQTSPPAYRVPRTGRREYRANVPAYGNRAGRKSRARRSPGGRSRSSG